MTAYVLPVHDLRRRRAGRHRRRHVRADRRRHDCWRYNYGVVQPQLTHRPETGGNLFGIMPYKSASAAPGIQQRDVACRRTTT